MLRIKYGIFDNNIDVTNICFRFLIKCGFIHIPKGNENRANYFTDPLFDILKSIFIYNNDELIKIVSDQEEVYIDTKTNIIHTETPQIFIDSFGKLKNIQSQLKIDFGSFNDEFPEQLMAVRYLTGNEKVLEFGGNIGRNSLVIAHILNNNSVSLEIYDNKVNFVSFESDPDIANQLIHNRELNNLRFDIEPSALSNHNLIQMNWDTIKSDVVLDGYKKVNTINYNDFRDKYKIDFDTLVIDCEGAFYYILQDMPQILDNIKLIIMENDYKDINHKNYIDDILMKNNFKVDYVESGGWGIIHGICPCRNMFFEVWIR